MVVARRVGGRQMLIMGCLCCQMGGGGIMLWPRPVFVSSAIPPNPSRRVSTSQPDVHRLCIFAGGGGGGWASEGGGGIYLQVTQEGSETRERRQHKGSEAK